MPEPKTIEGSFDVDGSTDIVDSFAPDTGAVYYVDLLRITCTSGSADGSDRIVQGGVRPASVSISDGAKLGSSASAMDFTGGGDIPKTGNSFTVSLGFFIDGSDTIYLAKDDGFNSITVSVNYQIKMRRVL